MIDWDCIDNCFLDMDGTLLDLHFDNHFWREHVPQRYAEARGLTLDAAKTELRGRYRDREGTLNWYCIDHWSQELGLDIALLKTEVDHLIAVHPHVADFLEAVAARGKRRVLVTNAHQKSLAIKMDRTRLAHHFERIISAHDLGLPKEDPAFWIRMQEVLPFDPARTLFVDDSLSVLRAARTYGLIHLIAVLEPDSHEPRHATDEFAAINNFADLLPGLQQRKM
ncbi:GMP/IMP nucleotidase [uncultured Lamprocystis sp.]|jgi:putative hydrolase of the HAD superfamily|uniref:GMP/IMP nucleotidase n=1 Tax=uncultured Lamprocystis sp. TaxID=543132 RepID=UPI0025D42079|nr:GMP/IMP nucleotidase [uncultured Lamprocystis sp.]